MLPLHVVQAPELSCISRLTEQGILQASRSNAGAWPTLAQGYRVVKSRNVDMAFTPVPSSAKTKNSPHKIIFRGPLCSSPVLLYSATPGRGRASYTPPTAGYDMGSSREKSLTEGARKALTPVPATPRL